MSKGALDESAAVNASSALAGAVEELRVKYALKDEADRKAAAAAEASKPPPPEALKPGDEGADSDSEWLDDPELERIRDARLKQLQERTVRAKEILPPGTGEYREIVEEEFLKEVTSTDLVVVHFYHNDFERCKIMDMHLRRVAVKYPRTKFLYLNAEKAPFFVAKLAVRVLPTVVMFSSGVAKDRLLGFERLGGDEFRTKRLERVLRACGVVVPAVGAEDTSSDEDDEGEVREGATYAEAMETRRSKIKVSEYVDGADD